MRTTCSLSIRTRRLRRSPTDLSFDAQRSTRPTMDPFDSASNLQAVIKLRLESQKIAFTFLSHRTPHWNMALTAP